MLAERDALKRVNAELAARLATACAPAAAVTAPPAAGACASEGKAEDDAIAGELGSRCQALETESADRLQQVRPK